MSNLGLKIAALNELDTLGLQSLKRTRVVLLCDPDAPPTASQLAKELGYQNKSGLTVLNQLEKAGVLERAPVQVGQQWRNGWRRTERVDTLLKQLGVLEEAHEQRA